MRPGQPVIIPMVTHSSWSHDLNVAYSVLRHQAGDDYAMMWALTFAHQVTSKLPGESRILVYDQVTEWVHAHDWLFPKDSCTEHE